MTTAIDHAKLEEFLGQAVTDAAAAESAAAIYLGDRLGLYRTLARTGPVTSDELARASSTDERYVREWLGNQVAGGYVAYDPATLTYELPPEQAAVLADEGSPAFLAGVYEIVAAVWAATDRIEKAFTTGEGLGWGEHDDRLYRGVERLFAPLYRSQLVQSWIPALDGVDDRLRRGARVADVGCGYGISTVILAQAYPASTFVGLDLHAPSIEAAREAAARAGVSDRCRFEVAEASGLPPGPGGAPYDLACFLDCLHDMGDPVGALRRVGAQLDDDGTVLIVEPRAGAGPHENANPVSRLFYAGSLFLCTPSALAQEGGMALGAQAGTDRLAEVVAAAGFGRFREAAVTPFNLVLEARK